MAISRNNKRVIFDDTRAVSFSVVTGLDTWTNVPFTFFSLF